ncbi:MAG: response regulator transcription factor [Lachnospiraceae bacterium]|nr:response regulator transcription factor [Lachnospiraceae bacterium]
MFTILIAEDNRNTARLMEVVLTQNGYQTVIARDGEEALNMLEDTHVDLILLDIMMPKINGYEFTRILRESGSQIPILMVTAKDRPDDIHKGFLTGTDDYMVKPVDEMEMLLRIQALLRRAKIAADHELVIGNTRLVYDSFSIYMDGEEQSIPKKEFQLLFKLLSFPNKTFTRNQLMEEFWAADSQSEERTVDVHINRLRDRFKNCADFEIITVRGLGYKAVRKDS